MKKILLALTLALLLQPGFSQSGKIRNVILFIPDGTSVDALSLARWYQGNQSLAIDELICGLSKTYSADSTIADSAPGGTALATGTKSLSGFVGADRDSLPHISLLELARLKGKSTGVVTTCEFPHATPADFVCHYPARSYSGSDVLIKQFVYNSPDLVFSGGEYYLDNYLKKSYSLKDTLARRGFRLINDLESFRQNRDPKVWALFGDWNKKTRFLSHDLDRDPHTEPALSEMTQKAIEILSRNPEGFFLMVEGSQIDWSSHSNEPVGLITDFLAFDKAVAEGVRFAKADGKTLVVVVPDHGNGGISLGNIQSGYSPVTPYEKIEYDNLNIDMKIAGPLRKAQWTGRKMASMIIADSTRYFVDRTASLSDSLIRYYGLDLPADSLRRIEKIVRSNSSADKKRDQTEQYLGHRFSEQHFIGWTTTGHTGEDVFLGIYAPEGIRRLTGVFQNTAVAEYIAETAGLGSLSADGLYFNRLNSKSHQFQNYPEPSAGPAGLVFEHRTKSPEKRITIPGNTDYYLIGNKRIQSKTLIVNIRNDYYVPVELIDQLRSKN